MPHIRPMETVESALRASDAGLRDADNALVHGVAIKTIRRWRRLYQRRGLPRGQTHTNARASRRVQPHVINDRRYVEDIDRIATLMATVKPGGRPHRRLVPGAVIVTVSWKHWPCLVPQHGPGRKHERPITLEAWQQTLLEAHPAEIVAGERKRYHYPRWEFSNTSMDIRELCGWALDLVDVPWRRSNWNKISVSTRAGVARLDELIGLKS